MVTYDDIFNPIENKKQDFIELFVEFFGEKYRERITNQINNTLFIFIDKYPQNSIRKFFSDMLLKINKDYVNECGLDLSSIFGVDDLKNMKLMLHEKGIKHGYFEAMVASFIKSIGLKVDTSINKFLKQGNNLKLIIDKIDEYIALWDKKYKDKYLDIQENCNQILNQISKNEETCKKIENEFKNKKIECITEYMRQRSFKDIDAINYFENEDMKNLWLNLIDIGIKNLNDEFLISEIKNSNALRDLLKYLGFRYGKNYAEGLKNKSFLNIIFNPLLSSKLDDIEYDRKEMLLSNNASYNNIMEQIKKFKLETSQKSLFEDIKKYLYDNSTTAICINSHEDNDLISICVCNIATSLHDETFIHEVGHAVESGIVKYDGRISIRKSGLDIYNKFDNENLLTEFGHRKYEILNEVIHDYLMEELANNAKNKGISIGYGQAQNSRYMYGFNLMKGFIEQNKQLIKECLIEDPFKLASIMGKENYDKLAHIVEECVEISSKNVFIEINNVIGKDKKSFFEIAHLNHKWSKETQQYLNCYLEAEKIFNEFNQIVHPVQTETL